MTAATKQTSKRKTSKRRPARRRAVEHVITTRGLTKRFGYLTAVHELDFEIERGEIFGYLGPNGAGKSTTIRMLLDFIRPTAGSYEVLGGSGADPAIRARVGYLPGELDIDPRYTTNDLVELFGDLRGGTDHERVDELCERFELDPTRPFGQLSTGNKRKAGIVQAFMSRPELYILDEPTAGLDPLLQHEFQTLIREVVGDGATVFLSSHALPEVEALADRVGIIRAGELMAVASVAELQRKARQRFDLYVTGRADVGPFEKLRSVKSASKARGVIRLEVEGNVDEVIKQAAKMKVRRIVTHETDLEDVFLDLYRAGDE